MVYLDVRGNREAFSEPAILRNTDDGAWRLADNRVAAMSTSTPGSTRFLHCFFAPYLIPLASPVINARFSWNAP
jgi:hypothetical protein